MVLIQIIELLNYRNYIVEEILEIISWNLVALQVTSKGRFILSTIFQREAFGHGPGQK